MEPITNRPSQILALPTEMQLLEDDGPGWLVQAEFRYETTDPYAVSIVFGTDEQPTVWTFARDLLEAGLSEPSGDGDVHVFMGVTDQGDAVLLVELATLDDEAILAALPSDIRIFLDLSYDLVPQGRESEHCDIDATITAILAGVTNGNADE